ncbi:hypothetical protein LCGC14_2571890, partial [marine sediment metagenome]
MVDENKMDYLLIYIFGIIYSLVFWAYG